MIFDIKVEVLWVPMMGTLLVLPLSLSLFLFLHFPESGPNEYLPNMDLWVNNGRGPQVIWWAQSEGKTNWNPLIESFDPEYQPYLATCARHPISLHPTLIIDAFHFYIHGSIVNFLYDNFAGSSKYVAFVFLFLQAIRFLYLFLYLKAFRLLLQSTTLDVTFSHNFFGTTSAFAEGALSVGVH